MFDSEKLCSRRTVQGGPARSDRQRARTRTTAQAKTSQQEQTPELRAASPDLRAQLDLLRDSHGEVGRV